MRIRVSSAPWVKKLLKGPRRKRHSLKPHIARSSCVPAPSKFASLREEKSPYPRGPLEQERRLGAVTGGLRATWGLSPMASRHRPRAGNPAEEFDRERDPEWGRATTLIWHRESGPWLANSADSLCGDETHSVSSGWRILRIRFAATRPIRSRLAGESCGFALRRRDLFGLVWLAILWIRFAASADLSLGSAS